MKLTDAEQNAFEALDQLLRLGQVKVTSLSLKNALWQHPDFPSLTALSDVLNDFKVPNLATRISPDRLADIPTPALAHLTTNGGSYAPIRKVGENIEWLDTQRGWQTENLHEFIHKWEGVTLLAQPDQASGEADYAEQRQKEIIENLRVPFAVGALLLCFGMFIYHLTQQYNFGEHWRFYALIATKTLGTVISGLLVWYSVDAENSFLNSVCKLGGKDGCNSILDSEAAKVFSWLSWSEVGLIYFGGTSIALFVLFDSDNLYQILFVISILSLPYTIYSIYYQAFIAKKLCILCLTIQLLLWVEPFIFIKSDTVFGKPTIITINVILLSFLVVFILWMLFERFAKKAIKSDDYQKQLQKIKFSSEYLSAVFAKQEPMPPIFEGMRVIEMGNLDAINILTIVTNPNCGPCRRNHEQLEKLLLGNPDFKCQIIFLSGDSNAAEVTELLLSMDSEQAKIGLDLWFKSDVPDLKKWVIATDSTLIENKVQGRYHFRWCQMAKIIHTPAMFWNGKELSQLYSLNDLGKLIQYQAQASLEVAT